jgi:hypothetical protein
LLPGQKIEPAIDRHRGMTLVCAHLGMGPPPDIEDAYYDALLPSNPAERLRRKNTDQSNEAQPRPAGALGPQGVLRPKSMSRRTTTPPASDPTTTTETLAPSGPETERP